MANIPEVYLLQATRKHLELAKSFQDDMGAHFFEHTMYDVKDALTSILALCDMEDMKQIPQVKRYIQRVTDLIHDVRIYHDSGLFSVNHVLVNVVNVLKSNYKSKIHIKHDISTIKAHTKSNQSHFEQVILYSLIEAVESSPKPLIMRIELAQRERDAVITIRLENFEFSSVALREIQDFHNPESFRMQLSSQRQETEITIRLPISFDVKEKKPSTSEESSSVKVSKVKRVEEKRVQRIAG